MSDRLEDLTAFLIELDVVHRLKRIRVAPSLYRELLLRIQKDDNSMILINGKPQAFWFGVQVDCDVTLTHAFELDYAA